MMQAGLRQIALEAEGFLEEAEGMCLYELARRSSRSAPCLEIGSYCGKSAIYLGEACRETGRHPLFTIDHHRGSAEHQPGADYFNPALWNPDDGSMKTLERLIRNIRRAGLDDWVIPVIGASRTVGRHWPDASLGLVFIDGGHSEEDAMGDYRTWGRCVHPGGYLCVHDVFANPADGGQAPYNVVCEACSSRSWEHEDTVLTLAILRRV
jgi:MMP 1-O-methyltransferase